MTAGRAAADSAEPPRSGRLEWLVVFLLPLGMIVIPFLGWAFGVVLLWASRVWSTREKLLATLLPPGGLSAAVFVALISTRACRNDSRGVTTAACHDGAPAALTTPLFVVFLVTGLLTPALLARRAVACRG